VSALVDQLTYHQIPEVDALKAAIDTVEKRLGKTVDKVLDFKTLEKDQVIGVESTGLVKYCGEFNEMRQQHGRCVKINRNGTITFEISEKGSTSLGKYLIINADGSF
jgi:hypothetical protein